MKKIVLMFAALLAFAVPVAFAAEHAGHGGGAHDKGHGGHQGAVAHEEVVDGVESHLQNHEHERAYESH